MNFQHAGGDSIAHVSSIDPSPVDRRSGPLVSLQDLVQHLDGNKQIKMLQSTVNKLCDFFEVASDAIAIEAMADRKEDFAYYLSQGKYKKNSIKSYLNYVRILLAEAKAAGWVASKPSIPEAWTAIFGSKPRHFAILRFLSKKATKIEDIGEDDLNSWVKLRVDQGGSYRDGAKEASWFRRTLVRKHIRHGLSTKKTRQAHVSVRLVDFPQALREEVEALIRWKTDDRVQGRPSKAQIRPATAHQLEGVITLLYGFAVNVDGTADINSVSQLVNQELTNRFVDWLFQVRGIGTNSVKAYLAPLSGAVGQHPKYKELDLKWLRVLIEGLPKDDGEAAITRKEQAYLSHDVVKSIPASIRAGRSKAEQGGKVALALQVRDELLMKWLSVLPWRQLNLRKLRIGGQTPNLYKAKIVPFRGVQKYPWVEQEEGENPDAQFWQIDFTAKETKTKKAVRILLPRRLVSLLEEYLSEHRGNLVNGKDPGTLFLNSGGTSLFSVQLLDIVKTQTLRHGGKAVHPHLFRDIYAYMWVVKYPGEILALSKLLWHSNLDTTVKLYARKFNESSALCRMETLIEE